MLFSLSCSLAMLGCPFFNEFLPDPTEVVDTKGEFVEIRMGSNSIEDTLFVRFENKTELYFTDLKAPRLLLHRDTLECITTELLDCRELRSPALPNTRESYWSLRTKDCVDTAYLPIPKPGKSFQRVDKQYDSWVLTEVSPGDANSQYELDIQDCGIEIQRIKQKENRWSVLLKLNLCDSTTVTTQFFPLMLRGKVHQKTLSIKDTIWVDSYFDNPYFRFIAELNADENKSNNRVDTILYSHHRKPVYITEIHHCPEDPVPEWVEVYNEGNIALALKDFSFQNRGIIYATENDSIYSKESLILTKDTTAFRAAYSIRDISLKRAALGYLKNASDTLVLLYKNSVMDSVTWSKELGIPCPNGFNPLSQKIENTPGFQGSASHTQKDQKTPFDFKVNTRILSKTASDQSLRVWIESSDSVFVELLSAQGNLLWSQKQSPFNLNWLYIPLREKGSLGAHYIRLSVGHYEKMVGVILRP